MREYGWAHEVRGGVVFIARELAADEDLLMNVTEKALRSRRAE